MSSSGSPPACSMKKPDAQGAEAMASEKSAAQATAESPAMAPLIPPAEYQRRRRRLLAAIGREGVAILTTAPEQVRNGHTHYPYRQASDFTYLTGFPEPEALLALIPGRKEGEVVLFCRPRDPEKEVWEGARAGVEGAIEYLRSRSGPSYRRPGRGAAQADRGSRPAPLSPGPRRRPGSQGHGLDPAVAGPGARRGERPAGPGQSRGPAPRAAPHQGQDRDQDSCAAPRGSPPRPTAG